MSELKSKSRMNNAQGKQKVYFSCHPHDFDTYFEELSSEILRIVDCAIYYYEPDENMELDEDYYLNLDQMQLFVMPITNKLLNERCWAMDKELPFARENHIPLLPIMLEEGLIDLFNQKFGSIQYLDRVSRDYTAISYKEKLEISLSKLLINDELTAKIREAFDAYVFLSYRKKDRKHAQNLMKLIHRNDFCRDIAIWYDDFLTGGENFNDAIAEALTKSDLFAMAVTPSLIDEGNYVMAIEYPMAINEGKSILPVELVPTNQTELQEKYKGIPTCTKADDGQALSDAIISKLRDLALQENAGDPQHDFFIGLAYLKGIDVEKDHERALKLIEGAADAGLIEAVKKIRDMYRYGDGVNLDLSKAADWTYWLIAQLKEQYKEEPTEANGNIWVKSYEDLGDISSEMCNYEDAVYAYDRMQELCLNLTQQWNSDETRRMLAVSYWKLGSRLRNMGDWEKAKKYLEKSLNEFKELYDSMGGVRAAWDLSNANISMGDFLLTENSDEALAYYMSSKKLLHEVNVSAESDEMKLCIAQSKALIYNCISNFYFYKNDLENAEQYSRDSIQITEQLATMTQGKLSLDSVFDLGANHNTLGSLFMEKEKWDEALEHYLISIDKFQVLYNTFHSPRYADLLHYLYGQLDKLEQIHMSQQNWKKAEVSCRRRLELIETLWEQETLKKKIELMDIYNQLGCIYLETGRFDEAKTYYSKALEEAEKVFKASPTVECALDLANCHYNIGMMYETAGREDLSINHYKDVISLCSPMSIDTENPEVLELLSETYLAMGDIHRQMDLIEDAREFYTYNVQVTTKLCNLTREPSDKDNMAEAYYDLALISSDTNDHMRYLNTAIDLWNGLIEQDPDRRQQYELKISEARALFFENKKST